MKTYKHSTGSEFHVFLIKKKVPAGNINNFLQINSVFNFHHKYIRYLQCQEQLVLMSIT
jgi:hypothetical protein